jgi:hypothetical protein
MGRGLARRAAAVEAVREPHRPVSVPKVERTARRIREDGAERVDSIAPESIAWLCGRLGWTRPGRRLARHPPAVPARRADLADSDALGQGLETVRRASASARAPGGSAAGRSLRAQPEPLDDRVRAQHHRADQDLVDVLKASARPQHGFLQPPKMSQQPPCGQKMPLLQMQPDCPPRHAGWLSPWRVPQAFDPPVGQQ